MDKIDKIESLMEGTNFISALNENNANLRDLGRHNLTEWNRMDPEKRTIAINLFLTLAADSLQTKALTKYGRADALAIKSTFEEYLLSVNNSSEAKIVRGQIRDALLIDGFMEQDADVLSQKLFDITTELIAGEIIQSVSKWEFLPRTATPRISDVLLAMLKEVNFDHN